MLRAEAKDSAGWTAFCAAAADLGAAERGERTGVKVWAPPPPDGAARRPLSRASADRNRRPPDPCSAFSPAGCRRSRNCPGPPGLRWSIDVDPLEVD
jgi:hypothetical protein